MISVPADYVYTGTGEIYFKVFSQSQTQGQPEQNYVITEYVSNLIGDKEVELNIPLFTVSNFRVTATTASSVTLAWDTAAWATGGYKVYKIPSWGNAEALTSTPITSTTYPVTESGVYSYAVVGVYGNPATEGNWTYLYNVLPGFIVPGNLSATVDQNNPLRIILSWDSVPHADYYFIYRDGNQINSIYYNTSFTDYDGSTLLGSEHSYTVKAYSSSYNKVTDLSAPAVVNLSLADLWVNNTSSGTISASGEVDYYRFTVPYEGYYRAFDAQSGIDVLGYVYVNGNIYTFDDGYSTTFYLYPGSEVIVAVRAFSLGTGRYGVRIEYY
jgi:hypothetical protein